MLVFQLTSSESSPLEERYSGDLMSGYRACDLFEAEVGVMVP